MDITNTQEFIQAHGKKLKSFYLEKLFGEEIIGFCGPHVLNNSLFVNFKLANGKFLMSQICTKETCSDINDINYDDIEFSMREVYLNKMIIDVEIVFDDIQRECYIYAYVPNSYYLKIPFDMNPYTHEIMGV